MAQSRYANVCHTHFHYLQQSGVARFTLELDIDSIIAWLKTLFLSDLLQYPGIATLSCYSIMRCPPLLPPDELMRLRMAAIPFVPYALQLEPQGQCNATPLS